ncbi:MAG: methyltransferase domain-containing protein [Candidatus Thorarchaeota archaeon]|jgi:SAM-dependent methyltransferase
MSVAFMAALEDIPENYDKAFDAVLEGRASQVRERIIDLVKPGMRVLDLGCGPGQFAIEASKKGASVVGIDANRNMIAVAQSRADGIDNPPEFRVDNILKLGEYEDYEISEARKDDDFDSIAVLEGEFDLIVSTFLLSELATPQRHLFMHIVQTLLKKDGHFAIASETLPKNSSDRREFWKNRAVAEKQAGKKIPIPIVSLQDIASDAGLDVSIVDEYGPEITYIQGEKSDSLPINKYQKRSLRYHGIKAKSRIWYNHTTGGWRGIPIATGLYQAGNPTANSPVVVTANYELTYYTVMRALAKDRIDAWVLVCDTAGINVWCAARGIHFDSEDVIQMVRITNLAEFVDHRELILPQLAAAGMDPTDIRERTGFRVRYGPVRIHDLGEWMKEGKPRPKPREMASVTFNLRERLEQSVAHIPFLYAAFLAKPMAVVLTMTLLIGIGAGVFVPGLATIAISTTLHALLLLIWFNVALFGNALILGILFPLLPSKGNSFWRRGLGLAGITLPIAFFIMLLMQVTWTMIVTWMVIQFVLATSLTLDWSGMTAVSDPKVIRREYPYMITTLKVGSLFVIAFNLIVFVMGW